MIEVKADYAKEMVTGFIRMNGVTVGVVANRSKSTMKKERHSRNLTVPCPPKDVRKQRIRDIL